MVRKIPVRKYRGKVKDPLGLIQRRNVESCANSAPKNPKEQEIPKSILEIKLLCEKAKNMREWSKKKKKKKKKNLLDSQQLFGKDPRLPGMTKPDSHLPTIVQMPGESKEKFFRRFHAATEDVVLEAKLQEKHQMTINRDEGGNITGFENDPGNDEDGGKKKKKRKLMKTSSAKTQIEGSSKKKLNKKQRLKMRQQGQQGSDDELPVVDFSMFKDEVKFGEVAHRPPQLTAPRGTDSLNSRPGIRNLLLKDLMKTNAAGDKRNKNSDIKKKNVLSAAQKANQEKNRLLAVAAYRQIKANKMKIQN